MKNNQSKPSQVNSALWTAMSEQQQQKVSGGYGFNWGKHGFNPGGSGRSRWSYETDDRDFN